MIFMFFYIWGDAKSGLTAVVPVMCMLTHCDQYPIFLHPDFLSRPIVSGSYSGCWLERKQGTFLVLTILLGLLHITSLYAVILRART